jgi:hypothetical protein
MSITVLYPFQRDSNFNVGYAWSAELSKRLHARHVIFTALASKTHETIVETYRALGNAQEFYIRYFQQVHQKFSLIRSQRHLLEGNFDEALLKFISLHPNHITVIESDKLSPFILRSMIQSGHRVVILPSEELSKLVEIQEDRAQLFIRIMSQVAVYNIPDSFFSALSQDHGIFNAIKKFFNRSL